jgi:hypothetical protein
MAQPVSYHRLVRFHTLSITKYTHKVVGRTKRKAQRRRARRWNLSAPTPLTAQRPRLSGGRVMAAIRSLQFRFKSAEGSCIATALAFLHSSR